MTVRFMKKSMRVLGVDDSEFCRNDRSVPVVGVLARLPSYIEAVMVTQVGVDGTDATDKIAALASSPKYGPQIRLIIMDGVTLGGFNVIDIARLYEVTGIPAVTVTRQKPDMRAIKLALKNNFPDWEARWAAMSTGKLEHVKAGDGTLYVSRAGISLEDCKGILRNSIAHGSMPEPVRMAHLIATAIARGESRGRV